MKKQKIPIFWSYIQIKVYGNFHNKQQKLQSKMIINECVSQRSIITPSSLLSKVQQIEDEAIYHFKQQKSKKFEQNLLSESLSVLNKSGKRKTTKKKDQLGLKRLIKQQKINTLVQKFIFKLKLNNANSQPIQYEPFEQGDEQSIYNINGIQISDSSQKILSSIIALQIIICVFVDTTAVIFPQIIQKPAIKAIQFLSITVFSIQLITSCILVKLVQGKKIQKVQAIVITYFHDGLCIDLAYLVVLIGGLIGDLYYLRLIILLKLPECFQRIEKLQNLLVNTFYKEQYWGLAKVFLLNFALSHFLSLVLLLMSSINKTNNWLIKFDINQADWFQQYVWGYYWGTTIMLTVGFGDITAANYEQAICLVLIQTFSCLALAYNINCVGNLIANIKSQDIQKNNNIKTFKLLSSRNNISEDLEIKIHNYIQQSTNIKKKFNFIEEHNFISTLPSQIKADFLKESNKKIFQSLLFIKNLTQKTLLAFSQVIQMKICHPQQVIKKRGQLSGLMILKQGKIGYCTKLAGSQFNNVTIQKICIAQNQNPFIVSLDFISSQRCSYEVKSQQYSIMYFLDRQKTIETLKVGQLDYEHFCFLRDKAKSLSTQFQVFKCQFCKSKNQKNNYTINHTKFDCPKLHYIPLKKHVVDKYLYRVKTQRNQRFINYDRYKKKMSPFKQLVKNLKLFQVNQKINQKYVTWRVNKKLQSKKSVQPQAFLIVTSGNIPGSKKKLWSTKFIINQNIAMCNTIDQDKKQQMQFMVNLMKDQFVEVLNKKQQVWVLQCDEIKNFKFYFVSFNASKLQGDRATSKKPSFV